MSLTTKKIPIFYQDRMAPKNDFEVEVSKSPIKPRLFMEYLESKGFSDVVDIKEDWSPLGVHDFLLAHSPRYVESFLTGRGNLADTSHFEWRKDFSDSVTYSTASLYEAIKYSVQNQTNSVSPVSGFHHARPECGNGFCAFSGQVIASVKLYKEFGWKGIYVDLDKHFGNSIEDTKVFNKMVEKCILANINPEGSDHFEYLKNLRETLVKTPFAEADYIVLCHGADSHIEDDMGGILDTEKWLEAGTYVKQIAEFYNKPVVLTFFGGYRADDYDSVLELHLASLLNLMDVNYAPKVNENKRKERV